MPRTIYAASPSRVRRLFAERPARVRMPIMSRLLPRRPLARTLLALVGVVAALLAYDHAVIRDRRRTLAVLETHGVGVQAAAEYTGKGQPCATIPILRYLFWDAAIEEITLRKSPSRADARRLRELFPEAQVMFHTPLE